MIWQKMKKKKYRYIISQLWAKQEFCLSSLILKGYLLFSSTVELMETVTIFTNLYKLWNRMSSGSYHPMPVRQVLIPKGDGFRSLGIPTVADRTAQMAAKMVIEPRLEQIFHPSSYGYRPGRGAKDAVAQVRRICWRYDWVLDMDIKAFFDTIDHELMMRAVEKHVPEKWIRIYIRRWLECPIQLENGELQSRSCGTPQGGVISPLLANLYMHYAFDHWMRLNNPGIPFARYADDVVCHCRTKRAAETLLVDLKERLGNCKSTTSGRAGGLYCEPLKAVIKA